MTQQPTVSNTYTELKQTLVERNYGQTLQTLQQLPLRNRWNTLFLLQRSFATRSTGHYVRALTHDLLYRAYREEVNGNFSEAQRLYRLLIQHNSSVSHKAREGFDRIRKGQPLTLPEQSHSTNTASTTPDRIENDEISLILLETVVSSQKKDLAVKLAQILKTDPYTARLTIPSIEFRMLRHGNAINIKPLHQALTAAGLPNRHISLKALQSIPVHDVRYIENVSDRLIVQVRDPEKPQQSIPMTVDWSTVQQRVDGLLPLFEEVVERSAKGKVSRKTETQDHAQICDLHLCDRQGILRFYDAGYQFNQGIPLVTLDRAQMTLDAKTSWAQWQGLKQVLAEHLPPIPEHLKFDHFANTAVEQIEILAQLNAQIRLCRRHDSYWDQAFHLYSTLHYLRLA